MLSPLDIESKKFIKSAVGGYNRADVDKFMELVLADYEKLYRENIALKDKTNTLSDAVDHYKLMEDTMQSTLLVAQSASEEVRNNAAEKARLIVEEANGKAADIIKNANAEMEKSAQKNEQLKRDYILFKSRVIAEFETYLKTIKSNLPNEADNNENTN